MNLTPVIAYNGGIAKPSPPVRHAANIWRLLMIRGVYRRSVPSDYAQVKYNPTTSLIGKSFNFNKIHRLYVKHFNSFCRYNPFNFNWL
jgi:hypothetical protein